MTVDEFLDRYLDEAIDELVDRMPEADVEFHPSPKLRRWLRKTIRQQRRSPGVNAAIRYAKRAAAVVLAASLLTFGGFMTVEANRTKLIQVVTEVFEILTSYFYTSDAPEDVPLADVEFGWLPDGMVEVARSETGDYRYILFEDNEGFYIDYTQQRVAGKTNTGQILDTEGAEVSFIKIGEIEAQVTSKNGEISILWVDKSSTVHLSSNYSIDLLQKTCENIILK